MLPYLIFQHVLKNVLFSPVDCSAAEAFFKQAIEIKENALGNDHPSLVKVRFGHFFFFNSLY